MDFKDKYLKYKKKYLKLKNQIGGGKIIKNKNNENQNVIIQNKRMASTMYKIVKQIPAENFNNRSDFLDFLYNYHTSGTERLLNDKEFRIIYSINTIIDKKIYSIQITEEDQQVLKNLINDNLFFQQLVKEDNNSPFYTYLLNGDYPMF